MLLGNIPLGETPEEEAFATRALKNQTEWEEKRDALKKELAEIEDKMMDPDRKYHFGDPEWHEMHFRAESIRLELDPPGYGDDSYLDIPEGD